MSLAFIPLYIKFMGVESYGLIGIFAAVQGVLAILDMGLTVTIIREMARLSALPGRAQEMRDLVRTLEVVYWGVAIVVGIAVTGLSPFIAHKWVKAGQLSPDTVEQAIRIMGMALALQWPSSFYSGGISGLQKQVLLNGINIGISTLRGVGAVLILWLVSPTIHAFFTWQIIINVLNTAVLGLFLWYSLPRTGKGAAFQKPLLAGVWKFTAGISGISALAIILTQLDKIVLSKMLTLEMFGYYTLAGSVAVSLYRLTGPVSAAIYPKLTELVSLADEEGVKKIYHKSSQLTSVLILPAAVVIALFSREIIFIWTQNPVTAEKTCLLASILVCGTALNGVINVPYVLQLAHGWTRLTVYVNSVSVVVLVPIIVVLARHFGAVGGASAWVILNVGYMFTIIPLMHRRLLPQEKWAWYLNDVGAPLAISVLVAGTGRLLMSGPSSQLWTIARLGVISAATLAAAAAVTPVTRQWVLGKIHGSALLTEKKGLS